MPTAENDPVSQRVIFCLQAHRSSSTVLAMEARSNHQPEHEAYHAVWPQIKALGAFLLSKVPVPHFVDQAITEAVALPPQEQNKQLELDYGSTKPE